MLLAWREQCSALLDDERSRRFILYSTGFVSLVTFSCYVEEWIFKALPGFKFPWMVAFVELFVFSCWAGAHQRWVDGSWSILWRRRAPLRLYAAFAVCLALSQSLGKVTFLCRGSVGLA
ncbi:unnamed protein product [Prorocentrum cordatum]|uniref:Alpha-1,3-glucosyltransferase n=1 Tax=Prorocentrum cordatum TaxID=2364126 RepID=A0ABN9WMG6_9DINO|nr:unnamed protein product [Polarella glacialis]